MNWNSTEFVWLDWASTRHWCNRRNLGCLACDRERQKGSEG